MERLNRLLVCLARDENDASLLAFAGIVSKAAGGAEVHVLHRMRIEPLPEDLAAKHPDLIESREAVEKTLADVVAGWVTRVA